MDQPEIQETAGPGDVQSGLKKLASGPMVRSDLERTLKPPESKRRTGSRRITRADRGAIGFKRDPCGP